MAALESLDAAGISYCVLRNYEQIPTEPGHDIDLVVEARDLVAVGTILHQVSRQQAWESFLRCSGHHEGTSFYFLTNTNGEGPVQQLEMHFTLVRWAKQPILRESDLLSRRVLTKEGIWVASPSDRAIQRVLQFGLSRQIWQMKDDYWSELVGYASRSGAELQNGLASVLHSRQLARQVVQHLVDGDRHRVAELMWRLRARFLLARLRRKGLILAADLARAVLERLALRVRSARCGVIGVVESADRMDEIAAMVEPMFRRTTIASGSAGSQTRKLASVVNQVGLALIPTQHRFRVSRRLRAVTCRIATPDPCGVKRGIVDQFVANHGRGIYPPPR
jgi:hypothetical protein